MSNLKILTLSELKFTSPDSLVTREGEDLTITKKTLKNLMNSLGLVGDKFSKDLYDIDETVWSNLVQRKCASSLFYTNNSAIIANEEIINIVSNNNREWLVKLEGIIKAIANIPDTNVKTLREEDGFSVICTVGRLGYVISVTVPDNHIIVQNIYLTPEDIVCITPTCTVNCKIDSGINCSDLEALLNHDTLIGVSDPENYAKYLEYLEQTSMSYMDSLEALKSIYSIRVKSTVPTPDIYTEDLDVNSYSMPELEFAATLLKEIYNKAYHYIPNASWLEKRLKFLDTPYKEFIAALSSRYLAGQLGYSVLAKYSQLAASRNLDYSVVKRIFSN